MINFFYEGIALESASGVLSSYADSAGRYRDISELKSMCYMVPEALKALYALAAQVAKAHGNLRITEMYRSWELQAQAYSDWVKRKRKAYAAPPGHSFHYAGRAIDIDIYALNFAGQKKEQWLKTLWDIALPLGWKPIIHTPDNRLSESWHFEYPGEWSYCYSHMRNGHVAQCAALTTAQWDAAEPQSKRMIRFLQAHLNRVTGHYTACDGIYGAETARALKAQGLDGASVTEASEALKRMNAFKT